MRTILVLTSLGLAACAVGFAFHGIQLMYDNSWGQRVVGGDAYNFIIYATRGTAYVGCGIVAALLSLLALGLALLGAAPARRDTGQP